jgi:hypothetical protein
MLKIGATQVYQDPIRTGINDIHEFSKTQKPNSGTARSPTICRCISLRLPSSPATHEAIGFLHFLNDFRFRPA